ncbi:MAG: hypothetical protein ACD_79C01242G0006 [uncultured bacterium]|nr:MAG: hypothetical protein ACD_79C01242G0006 [uncultured bacterium]
MKNYISRNIENFLPEIVERFPLVFIYGPRKSGKSMLLKKIFKNSFEYFTLENPILRESAMSDPNFFLSQIVDKNSIVDEIILVPELLEHFKEYFLKPGTNSKRFIFSLSQQYPLIKEIQNMFPERVAIVELLPLNYFEKIRYSNGDSPVTSEDIFEDFALNGCFPEIVTNKKKNTAPWYSIYLQTVLERDVKLIHNVENLRSFQTFLKLLASKCSQQLNLSGLAYEIGISVNTAKRWISILESSRIIYLLKPYPSTNGKRTSKVPKIYFVDVGLACYLIGIKTRKELFQSSSANYLFKNLCIQETLKYFYHANINPKIYYLRTHNGLEIDLIIEDKNEALHPVEIKFTKTIKKNMASSIQKFTKLFLDLNIQKGRMTSLSCEKINLGDGMIHHSLSEYLNWLNTFN